MVARRARTEDVEAICRICAEGWRDTYVGLHTPEEIEATIARFYIPDRVAGELTETPEWGGWWVAEDPDGRLAAAGGGGLTDPKIGEVFVLYADPTMRYRGAGTAVLEAMTAQQIAGGAREQWVSVGKGNRKGIPFYEARGFILAGERPTHEMPGHASLRYRRPLEVGPE